MRSTTPRGGNWKARLGTSEGVEILGIDGVDFPQVHAEDAGRIYWAFWINHEFASSGACSEELTSPESDIVFFAQCYEVGPLCPTKTRRTTSSPRRRRRPPS